MLVVGYFSNLFYGAFTYILSCPAAFLVLGFYVQAAFKRYSAAGTIWGDHLRSACQALAAQWLTLYTPGMWHEGDVDRVIAHIAAVPIVLKQEMRDERDLRDLKGLLSQEDVGRIQSADNMAAHCIDVIRSYLFVTFALKDKLARPEESNWASRVSYVYLEILELENATRTCRFLKEFRIAPPFVAIVRALLAIWFILLPFGLAESSGTSFLRSRNGRPMKNTASKMLTAPLDTFLTFCRFTLKQDGLRFYGWL